MTVSFVTFGCKVNQYESQEMLSAMLAAGFVPTRRGEGADVYVVNSCTVTEESSHKVRQRLRRLRKERPDACIVLTGCYTQAFTEEASALGEADIVLGNKTNSLLVPKVRAWLASRSREVDVSRHERTDAYTGGVITGFEGHTRAFVKIQDGCNRYCTYCIIPKARGFSRSRPLDDVEREIKALAENGFREVVFVGINLSAYGLDFGGSLCDALDIAERTAGIERVRLGSLEPDHITDEVIARLAAMKKFCPQFHLSLQSGDDGVLRRMNRHYTTAEYSELCGKLKSAFPDLSLTTDVITGFPGETEEAFANSVAFVRKIGFMKVHAFPFSPRRGTPAYDYPDKVPTEVKAERVRELLAAADEVRADYMRSYVGRTLDVLFETPERGYQVGYTKNYIPVRVPSAENLQGRILAVRIESADKDGCEGVLASHDARS